MHCHSNVLRHIHQLDAMYQRLATSFRAITRQVLHKVADVPLICHALSIVIERGWGPLVVVLNPQNESAVKEVCNSLIITTKRPVFSNLCYEAIADFRPSHAVFVNLLTSMLMKAVPNVSLTIVL